MALASWWLGDPLPALSKLETYHVAVRHPLQLVANFTRLPTTEVKTRLETGNKVYIAYLSDIPVAYGWAATGATFIGELGLAFTPGPLDRYLWDFQTLPWWRGQGVYPHLLQSIIHLELEQSAERFWIIYAPENKASAGGINKAGFRVVGELSFSLDHKGIGFAPASQTAQAHQATSLLTLPLADQLLLSDCWQCFTPTGEASKCGCQIKIMLSPSATVLCQCYPGSLR